MEKVTFSRVELFDLIWSKPLTKLGQELGISDRGLAKLCDRHKIPRPPQGYWIRLELGKAGERPALPSNSDLLLESISFFPGSTDASLPPPPLPAHALDHAQLAKAMEYKIPVRVGKFHPYIELYRQRAKEPYGVDRYGRIWMGRSGVDPNLKVTPKSMDRACLFLQGMINLFDTYGWKFEEMSWKRQDSGVAGFHYNRLSIDLEIKEIVKQMPHKPKIDDPKLLRLYGTQSYDYLPTGVFEVSVGTHIAGLKSKWKDSDKMPVEQYLYDIVQVFSRGFEDRRLRAIEAEKQRRKWEEEEALRKERHRLMKVEETRRKQLFDISDQHHRVTSLRTLISALRQQSQQNEALQSWLEWAEGVADDIDPLKTIDNILESHRKIGEQTYF
jgi:hypothetical protein